MTRLLCNSTCAPLGRRLKQPLQCMTTLLEGRLARKLTALSAMFTLLAATNRAFFCCSSDVANAWSFQLHTCGRGLLTPSATYAGSGIRVPVRQGMITSQRNWLPMRLRLTLGLLRCNASLMTSECSRQLMPAGVTSCSATPWHHSFVNSH